MRTPLSLLLALSVAEMCAAQQTPTINFNLVQVNHYHGQEQVVDSLVTPGARIVIDLQNPTACREFAAQALPAGSWVKPLVLSGPSLEEMLGGIALPWESQVVLRGASGADSFLVTSSRAGCPGTEVRPSVAVAFATGSGWSDPPIRFGPLSERSVCPLGRGYQLEVRVTGDRDPRVGLREAEQFSGRR